ncbi:uncharacterized protein B0H18DRAFT_839225, partial [Fomitopsis serialis]|uniref:uncharacterized protein n=1 Tax=Fomitopsis serialis TaxID=139415 RepID=UPI002007EBD3
LGELDQWKYRCTLNNLECLVVQHLLELTKLGMSGTGYKMREKIGKALKTRAEAVRKALTEYNHRAAQLVLPWPSLTWSEVMEMTTLSEFDLLLDARQDIRQLPWACRANCKAMTAYFNVKRVGKEIKHLNVEMVRLFTFIIDEHYDFYHAISRNLISRPELAHELSTRWLYRNQVNKTIVHRLYKVTQLPGYTGNL